MLAVAGRACPAAVSAGRGAAVAAAVAAPLGMRLRRRRLGAALQAATAAAAEAAGRRRLRGSVLCRPPPAGAAAVLGVQRRWCTQAAAAKQSKGVRNIGIIAHIDAGKTTTTELMLYAAQVKDRRGEVDRGTTTTDYMDQERERGITIQSAVVNFWWRDNHVHLIDTPGHADFTIEVERALRVLDGAVAVFDGVKGVEAQSRTVLRQAERFGVPFVSYVNKMDRPQADYEGTLAQLESHLGLPVLPMQMPLVSGTGFEGVCDLVACSCFRWSDEDGQVSCTPAAEEDPAVYSEVKRWRTRLLESLSDLCDDVAGHYLECMESGDDAGLNVPSELIVQSTATACRARRATPALCGSSARGKGVEPLLDAVCDLLPGPTQRPPLTAIAPGTEQPVVVSKDFGPSEPLVAFVFKVLVEGLEVRLAKKSILVRVYCGTLRRGTKVQNSTRGGSAVCRTICRVQGNSWIETDELGPGMIGLITGLDNAATGDTLQAAGQPRLPLEGVSAPVPVVSASIEPYSDSEQRTLSGAVQVLRLEDPSLSCEVNDYGQTVLSGMGQLHLEVAKTRLERNWKLSLTMGDVRIKYQEWLRDTVGAEATYEAVPGDSSSAVCTLRFTVTPMPLDALDFISDPPELLTMPLGDHTSFSEQEKTRLRRKWAEPLTEGFAMGLARGPRLATQIRGVQVHVHRLQILSPQRASEDTLRTAADHALHVLIESLQPGSSLPLEPCMDAEIRVWAPELHDELLSDILASRRGAILQDDPSCIRAVMPLSELLCYAQELASMSRGNATLQYHFRGYRAQWDANLARRAEESCRRR
eukprot:TRINITY_DN6870_c0_g1_i1.p1 TRINITY_DN6870_c0_g1~~TRINITY_DN6870_c0_g1_i1.p1  ORF type:complete len:813 (+),score=160.32 TRINITY_DN6870_c0_g1_i1:113-2551(+)